MADIEQVIGLYQDYHWPDELRLMNKLASQVKDGVIVAIGSYRGQMDCALALNATVPVYCIDPRFQAGTHYGDVDRSYWMRNVLAMDVAEKVRPINLSSWDAVRIWENRPIGLLLIDGDHNEVGADLDVWVQHVVDGGLVCVHDNNFASVVMAVTKRTDIVEVERVDRTTVYRKEPLYYLYSYDGLALLVRKGPYNKDDKYVAAEVRSYDIGDEPVRNFIDIGAAQGWFSAWIKQKWPDAQGVAVEPEQSNYLLCALNLEPFGVQVLRAHVNYINGLVLEVDPVNVGSHMMIPSARAPQPGKSAVEPPPAIGLEWIMRQQGWSILDLLKVDCESCESDVLLNCEDDTLRSIRRIVGEWHSNFGSPIEPIAAKLQSLGFTVTWEHDPTAHAVFLAVNSAMVWEDTRQMINRDYAENERKSQSEYNRNARTIMSNHSEVETRNDDEPTIAH